jgi:hypothetical protein
MVLKNFEKLLSYDDLNDFLELNNPYSQAKFISSFIKDICMIKNDKLYIKTDINIYKKYKNKDTELLCLISELYADSIDKLSNVDRNSLKNEYKNYVKFQSNYQIKKFLPQLKVCIVNNE